MFSALKDIFKNSTEKVNTCEVTGEEIRRKPIIVSGNSDGIEPFYEYKKPACYTTITLDGDLSDGSDQVSVSESFVKSQAADNNLAESNTSFCFCGRPSVSCDNRFFSYCPCVKHQHLNPVVYSHMAWLAEQGHLEFNRE